MDRKTKKQIGVVGCIGVLLLLITIANWNNSISINNEHRYAIGQVTLADMQFVDFPLSGEEPWFLCPDSAVEHCMESNWKERDDVYKCVLGFSSESNSMFLKWKLLSRPWDICYYPYEPKPYKRFGDSISIHHLQAGVNRFDVYMEACDAYYYSSDNAPYADDLDKVRYSKQYRIALRPHFSNLQIFRLRKQYKHTRHKDIASVIGDGGFCDTKSGIKPDDQRSIKLGISWQKAHK